MGQIINNTYELLEQLGQGGMGVVYKARHINFDEIVAVKRLWEQYGSNQIIKNLFFNEGRILRRFHHKNIVQVSDLFEYEGSQYIVMEFIEGRSLHEIIKKETGPIRRERAINLFKQMLLGIAYVHNQNPPVIHRDIKPLNILVTSNDIVKITDFGIAKALDAGGHASTIVKGTPVYMSPEQIITPSTVDIRTDVYALGMTFYEMLCGRTPFDSNKDTTPTAVYHEIMSGQIPAPTKFYPVISDSLVNYVMKAINKDRNLRHADAAEMLIDLERIESRGETALSENQKFNPPVTKKYVPQRRADTEHRILENKETHPLQIGASIPRRKNSWKMMLLIVLFICIVGGISLLFKKKVEQYYRTEGSTKGEVSIDTITIVSVQGDTYTYIGPIIEGMANGQGEAFFTNGNKYKGIFSDNKRNEKGIFFFKDGGSYEGEWKDDRMNGFGKYTFEDGSYYIGNFQNDLFNGKGTYYDRFGNTLQDGFWRNDSLISK